MIETCKYVRPNGTQCKQWHGIVDGYCKTHQPQEVAKLEERLLVEAMRARAARFSELESIELRSKETQEQVSRLEEMVRVLSREIGSRNAFEALTLARDLLFSGASRDEVDRASVLVDFAKEARLTEQARENRCKEKGLRY